MDDLIIRFRHENDGLFWGEKKMFSQITYNCCLNDRLMYPFYSPIIVDLCWFNMIYYDSIECLIRLNPMT